MTKRKSYYASLSYQPEVLDYFCDKNKKLYEDTLEKCNRFLQEKGDTLAPKEVANLSRQMTLDDSLIEMASKLEGVSIDSGYAFQTQGRDLTFSFTNKNKRDEFLKKLKDLDNRISFCKKEFIDLPIVT